MVVGAVTAVACAGIGLAVASRASALPAQRPAARQFIATAAVGRVGIGPESGLNADQVDALLDMATDAVVQGDEAELEEGMTPFEDEADGDSRVTRQASPGPAEHGAVPADAQFNAG